MDDYSIGHTEAAQDDRVRCASEVRRTGVRDTSAAS